MIIAGLVALASLATAALVTTGARQLNSAPAQTTTPYIAAQPNGPVHVPDVSATTGSAGAATSRDAAKPRAPGGAETRERSEARPPKPRLPRAPERTTENAPRTPELGTPPPTQDPPSADRPRLPRECRAAVPRALHGCVVRIPRPPKPPAFPSPPWH